MPTVIMFAAVLITAADPSSEPTAEPYSQPRVLTSGVGYEVRTVLLVPAGYGNRPPARWSIVHANLFTKQTTTLAEGKFTTRRGRPMAINRVYSNSTTILGVSVDKDHVFVLLRTASEVALAIPGQREPESSESGRRLQVFSVQDGRKITEQYFPDKSRFAPAAAADNMGPGPLRAVPGGVSMGGERYLIEKGKIRAAKN